jgi:hypothetical protein
MIPSFVHPFLWSYDIEKLDLSQNRERIITNVLNLGTTKAVDWLFKVYNKKEIKEVVANPLPGEWNNKSLNFWSIILEVEPSRSIRKTHVL